MLHEIGCVPLPLIILVDGELAEQERRHGIGSITLLGFWKKGTFDLRRAQGHVADDAVCRRIGNDAYPRKIVGMIEPGMAAEPSVHRVPTAVENVAIVGLSQGARRGRQRPIHCSQVGTRRASAARPGFGCAGRLSHVSKASQSLAGMVTIVRLSTSVSAASTALRRTKSLRLVCAWSAAASRSARSLGLTRTLSIVVATGVVMCITLAYEARKFKEFGAQRLSRADQWVAAVFGSRQALVEMTRSSASRARSSVSPKTQPF